MSTAHKFYFDLGPKRYLGPRDPIIGSGLWARGVTPIVQCMDFFPVNDKCKFH